MGHINTAGQARRLHDEVDITPAARDALRLMDSLLGMPLRVVARYDGLVYRVVAVADRCGVGLTPGQIIRPDEPLAALLAPGESPAPGLLFPSALRACGLARYVSVPIERGDGSLAGSLSAAAPYDLPVLPTQRESLVVLARMLSHEIERADRERELRVLAGISQAFVRQTDLAGMFQELVRQAVELFEADYCLLHQINLAEGHVTLVTRHGVPWLPYDSRPIRPEEEESATIQVARSGQVLWVADTRTDPHPDRQIVERFNIASILYLPLVVDGVTQGVLTVAHRHQPFPLTPALRRVAEILANEAALALRRHQLHEATERRQRELAVLNELSTFCTAQLAVEPLLRGVPDAILRVIPDATDCFILLADAGEVIRPAAASGDRHAAYQRTLLHSGQPSVSREVLRTGAPVIVPDMSKSPFANPLMQQSFPLGSCLGVALTARGKTLGALLVGHRTRPHVWTSDEVNRLQTAANQVALSIDNVQLYEEVRNLAIHDPLTGVYNRRYLEQRLHEEVARSTRYDRPLSCIMVDLDHFKRINDQYGHATGDRVLQEFARRITPVARRNDVLARYGGEEFTLLLPECTTADALRTAERIRGVVARRPFRVQTERGTPLIVPITASLGVCSRTPAMQRPDQLLNGADTALYEAKHQGRNRVACQHFDHTGPLYEILKG